MMKKALFTLSLFLLSACALPALPLSTPGAPAANPAEPSPASPTPLPPTATLTPTFTPTPTASPSITPSRTPTPKPIAGFATPVFDRGYPLLGAANAAELQPIFASLQTNIRHTAASRDGSKLFLSASDGMYVINRAGEIIAHYPNISTFQLPCQTCFSVNADGSRFALISRQAGRWQAQVYETQGESAALILQIPLEAEFNPNAIQQQIALSPGGEFLAYSGAQTKVQIFSLKTGLQLYQAKDDLTEIAFTADSRYFTARRGRELLLFAPDAWQNPRSLILPSPNTPYTFSQDGLWVSALHNGRVRVYNLGDLKLARELNAPALQNAQTEWEFSYPNANTLRGLGLLLEEPRLLLTLEWNLETGALTRTEEQETTALSLLAANWGGFAPAPLATPLRLGEYQELRFVSDGLLLVNTAHNVCWLRLFTGEALCQTDEANRLLAADAQAFREVRLEYRTELQKQNGETVLDVGAYQILRVNRSGDWALVDIRGLGTDLYTPGKTLPQESVGGAYRAFAESGTVMTLLTQQQSKKFVITLLDKESGKTIALKEEVFLYPIVTVSRAGVPYLLKKDFDKGKVVVLTMKAENNYNLSEAMRLALPAAPVSMAFSSMDEWMIFGLEDGSVFFVSPDGQEMAGFQAFDSAVTKVSLSPDGRWLAAASADGLRVFVGIP